MCHAYCLMGNHYHLLVETPRANLGVAMHRINCLYSNRFNRVHERDGHVLERPYRAWIMRGGRRELEAARYIARNPVRAGLCAAAELWPWSSHAATSGLVPRPAFLSIDRVRAWFGADEDEAVARYRHFVAVGTRRAASCCAEMGEFPARQATGVTAGSPPRTATTFRAASTPIAVRVSTVADPRWGMRTAFSRPSRSGCTSGSRSKTSSPAPEIAPERRAAASAASSTTGPRVVLTRNATASSAASAAASIRWCVSALRGQWSETTSALPSSSSSVTKRASSSASTSAAARRRPE